MEITLGWFVELLIDEKQMQSTYLHGEERFPEASLLADKISAQYYNIDCGWMVKVSRITPTMKQEVVTSWNYETHMKFQKLKWQKEH